MTLFLENFDKDEGVINQLILPRISQIANDDIDNFIELTSEYLKDLIMTFDIFTMPPANVISDFPILYEKSKLKFIQDLKSIDNTPALDPENAYSNFLNNLFSLFTDITSDLLTILQSSTISVEALSKYEFININDDIKKILKYVIENTDLFSNISNEKVYLINSYINYFIVKYIASQYVLLFTLPPPAPPITLPIIASEILTPEKVSLDLENEVKKIIEEI